MKHRALIVITLFAACSGATSATSSAVAPVPGSLRAVPAPSLADRANVERLERSLAHDSMEGRGTATRGGAKAARFLAAEMKRIGLTPGGDSGFFQRVPMAMTTPPPRPAGAGRGPAAGTPDTPAACLPTGAPTRTTSLTVATNGFETASITTGRGGRGGAGDSTAGRGRGGGGRGSAAANAPGTAATPRPRLSTFPSLADLDTVPADRRRNAVNVIGILPGGDNVLKGEVVLVLSHYDHLGMRTPATPGGDSVFNGADDDAAGTVAVLEVARLLKRAGTPKRTIVFANMTGEEVGLLGTNYFINHPVFPLTQIVAGFEIEMIGRPDSLAGGPGKAWLTGYERSTMGDMLKQYGIAIVPDHRPDQNFFSRSDNIGFARRGIVAHTLSTFNLHKDYHQLSDDVDKIDFDHMTGVIHSAAEAVRHLADGPKPEWHAGCSPQPPANGRQ